MGKIDWYCDKCDKTYRAFDNLCIYLKEIIIPKNKFKWVK